MKINCLLFFIFTNLSLTFSQEWKNLRTYQTETNQTILAQGCWLKHDRITKDSTWNNANKYNLKLKNGFIKYKSIKQIHDFYLWFDSERIKQGHEIKWIGIAAIAANQLSKLDNWFIRKLIVRNKEIANFAHKGSEKVFEFSFPKLKSIYFSTKIITGIEAQKWDKTHGKEEQCSILGSLYKGLSKKAFKKLNNMAKGKGIYSLGVSKKIRFEGNLDNCESRFNHGEQKLIPYYSTTVN